MKKQGFKLKTNYVPIYVIVKVTEDIGFSAFERKSSSEFDKDKWQVNCFIDETRVNQTFWGFPESKVSPIREYGNIQALSCKKNFLWNE